MRLGGRISAAIEVLARVLEKRYDPDGLFTVHHGVGSESWSESSGTPTNPSR